MHFHVAQWQGVNVLWPRHIPTFDDDGDDDCSSSSSSSNPCNNDPFYLASPITVVIRTIHRINNESTWQLESLPVHHPHGDTGKGGEAGEGTWMTVIMIMGGVKND